MTQTTECISIELNEDADIVTLWSPDDHVTTVFDVTDNLDVRDILADLAETLFDTEPVETTEHVTFHAEGDIGGPTTITLLYNDESKVFDLPPVAEAVDFESAVLESLADTVALLFAVPAR